MPDEIVIRIDRWEDRRTPTSTARASKSLSQTTSSHPPLSLRSAIIPSNYCIIQPAAHTRRRPGQKNHLHLLVTPALPAHSAGNRRQLRESSFHYAVPSIYVRNSLSRSLSGTSLEGCPNPASFSGDTLVCSSNALYFGEVVVGWTPANQFGLLYL